MSTVRETYGLACPNCGRDTDLVVEAITWVNLSSTPIRKAKWADFEWRCCSPCRCEFCNTDGPVAAFTVPDGGAS